MNRRIIALACVLASLSSIEYARADWNVSTIATFNSTNGAFPYGGVTLDAGGNLYGTTFRGGAVGVGSVWQVAKGSNSITTLASFNGDNGRGPQAGVTLDAVGNLYGSTTAGGGSGAGTVWEIAKGSNSITTLASFSAGNSSGVTLDAAGNLFGTTSDAGTANKGTVWEIAKGSNSITTLASFNNINGANPIGGVTLDAVGNLYGTTYQGGSTGNGIVWEIAKGSSVITTLASFNSTNGSLPMAGVTFDVTGNLYGTTVSGGTSGQGTVWEIAKGSGTITTLASFNGGGNGSSARGGVTLDAAGNLYGTASQGGASNVGTVWEVVKGSNAITSLFSFNGGNGANPYGVVALDSAGILYGATQQGGVNSDGTVFELSQPAVPEPSSIVLITLGGAGICSSLWRKRHIKG